MFHHCKPVLRMKDGNHMNEHDKKSILKHFTVEELFEEIEDREETTVLEAMYGSSEGESDETPVLRTEDLSVLFEEGALIYLPSRKLSFSFR